MRKEVADLWVAALRSGEYRQTTLQLRAGDGYCCLGVLCDLHAKQTGQGKWAPHGYYESLVTDDTDGRIPTKDVAKWAGLSDRSPHVYAYRPGDDGTALLTALNDGDGYTFAQLADLIEAQWEEM